MRHRAPHAPPQSTSVSSPFCAPSEQLTHIPVPMLMVYDVYAEFDVRVEQSPDAHAHLVALFT